ncbi:MASE1 domain-containing protein [Dyella silvatica]|uniref:MASE1 domain-containing protein n=1 Tax=Dyella silvatica TaxID=2992128 RepID=UPI002257F68B|nr:MASE1 domain-containing protein [Dyella silvatica]
MVVAYVLGYTLLRQISFSHWFLPSGFRLSLLLLVPRRYWAALAVGEWFPLAYTSYTCLDELGPIWSAVMVIPPIALAMPIVHWCRKRLVLFPSGHSVNMGGFLFCTLLVSLLWSVLNLIAYAVARFPVGYRPDYAEWAGRYFLGNYLGILTITPLVLLVREILQSGSLNRLPKRLASSRLLIESVSLLLPALALLTWLGVSTTGDVRQVARIAMFLPVSWLALRHGWRGAAFGGAMASIGIVLTMPALYDHATQQAQVLIAFTITTLLMLGSRIAVLREGEQQSQLDGKLAFDVAQRSMHLSELRLRQTAYAIESIGSAIQQSHHHLLGQLRRLLPSAEEEGGYQRQAKVMQQQVFRLADSMYPLVWRGRGLPTALHEGTIARALSEAGVSYQCDIQGRGLSQLSPDVHIALYRIACEAVVYLLAQKKCTEMTLCVRSGLTHGRRWAVLRLVSRESGAPGVAMEWQDLVTRLGASGLGLAAIEDRARIYGGQVHVQHTLGGLQVSALLHDSQAG